MYQKNLSTFQIVKNLQFIEDKNIAVLQLSSHKDDQLAKIMSLFESKLVDYSYGFKNDGQSILLTDRIVLKFKSGNDLRSIETIIKDKAIFESLNYQQVLLKTNTIADAMPLANQIYESGFVEWCHPDFMIEINKHSDPKYPEQYYLKNTGQLNAWTNNDIKTEKAWSITTGSPSIKVAIIDDGVEDHEDMNDQNGQSRVLSGYTVGGTNNGRPILSTDGHSEAVAGIIAASHNSIGVRGVAPNVKILPVNITQNGRAPADIAYGINWAWQNGADILCCPWGIENGYYDAIVDAIYQARINGRNGKGSVVIFSAGNNGTVEFPSYVEGVICVGSINGRGQKWGYSPSNSRIDVVVPTGDKDLNGDIRTIDRMGTAGYNSGNSMNNFGGSSAACAQVTGVAALILSLNLSLNENGVKYNIISTTTDRGNPGKDNDFGYGVLNAFNAVAKTYKDINSQYQYILSNGQINKIYNNARVVFLANSRPGTTLAGGVYIADIYLLQILVNNSSYISNPLISYNGLAGFALENPNTQEPMIYQGIDNENYSYFETFFYYIEYPGNGMWVPFDPNTILSNKEYTILGDPIDPPSISSITQSPSPLYRGQYGLITCNAAGDNLTYTWTVQSKPDYITLGSLSGPTLSVSNISKMTDKVGNGNLYMKPPVDLIVTCHVSNSMGSVARICTANVIPGDPPSGGCPFLFVQSDNGYIMDNNLLHRSEFEGNTGKDIKDIYKLKVNPVADKNKLKFQIKELNHDHSYFDRIKLYSVDHPSGTEIGVTENNDIVLYLPSSVVSTSNAILNDKNITNLIQYNLKSPGVEGVLNERIFMSFDAKKIMFADALKSHNTDGSTDSMAVIMNIKGIGSEPVDPPKEMAGTIDGSEAAKKTTFQRGFARREKQSVVIVPLGNNVSLESLNIEWFRNYDMQYAAVTPVLYGGYEKNELNLVTADHSVHGNIKQLLKSVDKIYAELDTNGFITLTFNAGGNIKSGWVRDYVIETDGYYVRPGEGEKTGLTDNSIQKELLSVSALPTKFELNANYPNPFNPSTTIEYAVPHQGFVTIKVYDALGREVATLVNDNQAQGRYKVTWNAAGLSSGIYIYRMTAKDYKSVRKMLLLK